MVPTAAEATAESPPKQAAPTQESTHTTVAHGVVPLTEGQERQKRAEDRACRIKEDKQRRQERIAAERAKQERIVQEEAAREATPCTASVELNFGEKVVPMEGGDVAQRKHNHPNVGEMVVPGEAEAEAKANTSVPADDETPIENKPIVPGETETSLPTENDEISPAEDNATNYNNAVVPTANDETQMEKIEAATSIPDNNKEPVATKAEEPNLSAIAAETPPPPPHQPLPLAPAQIECETESTKEAQSTADMEWEKLSEVSELSDDIDVINDRPREHGGTGLLLGPLLGDHDNDNKNNGGNDNDDDDELNLLEDLLSDNPPFRHASKRSAPLRTMNEPAPIRTRSYSPLPKPRLATFTYNTFIFDSNSRTAQSQLAFVEQMKSARKGSSHSLVGSFTDSGNSTKKKSVIGDPSNVFERLYQSDIATYSAKRIN